MALPVRPVGADEAAPLRALRLTALASDPDAFATTYERDAARPTGFYEAWARASAEGVDQRTFIAGDWQGLALVRRDEAVDGAATLLSMWVAPEARGQGTAAALCDACAAWAARRGLRELRLRVLSGNAAARRAYTRAGFVDHDAPAQAGEQLMVRRLSAT